MDSADDGSNSHMTADRMKITFSSDMDVGESMNSEEEVEEERTITNEAATAESERRTGSANQCGGGGGGGGSVGTELSEPVKHEQIPTEREPPEKCAEIDFRTLEQEIVADCASQEEFEAKMSRALRGDWLKIGEVQLAQEDRYILSRVDGWLTDCILNAAQELLKRQFYTAAAAAAAAVEDTVRSPSSSDQFVIHGLQDVCLQPCGQLQPIPAGGKFVQILHEAESHWVVASNVIPPVQCGFPAGGERRRGPSAVTIYDSKRDYRRYETIHLALSQLLPDSYENSQIFVPWRLTQQLDDSQCGVYAVAFARTLAAGEDPLSVDFSADPAEIRGHLTRGLAQGRIDSFPVKVPVRDCSMDGQVLLISENSDRSDSEHSETFCCYPTQKDLWH